MDAEMIETRSRKLLLRSFYGNYSALLKNNTVFLYLCVLICTFVLMYLCVNNMALMKKR